MFVHHLTTVIISCSHLQIKNWGTETEFDYYLKRPFQFHCYIWSASNLETFVGLFQLELAQSSATAVVICNVKCGGGELCSNGMLLLFEYYFSDASYKTITIGCISYWRRETLLVRLFNQSQEILAVTRRKHYWLVCSAQMFFRISTLWTVNLVLYREGEVPKVCAACY